MCFPRGRARPRCAVCGEAAPLGAGPTSHNGSDDAALARAVAAADAADERTAADTDA
eukprot:gene3715-54_t